MLTTVVWLVALLLVLFLIGAGLTWMWAQYNRFRRELPKPSYKYPQLRPEPHTWRDEHLTATWVGHSTVYMNMYGMRIITDPVFSERVGVKLLGLATVGPKRHTAPALPITEVQGNVDLLLLSHAHMDHLDIPSLKKLATRDVEVVTAEGTGGLLAHMGFGRIVELKSGQTMVTKQGVSVTAVPVRHWGARFPWNKTYGWTGYLIEYQGRRVLFPGDTAYTSAFTGLADAGPIDLAFMPIGAYSPDSFQGSHCTPEQAWQMFVDSGAQRLVPIHWDTFVLSREPVDEPLRRLLAAAGDEAERIVISEHGETFTLEERPAPEAQTREKVHNR